MSWKLSLLILTLALITVSTAFALRPQDKEEEDDRIVKFSDIPSPAQSALKKAAGSATIAKIEIDTNDSVTIYEASWNVDGIEHEASVDPTGSLLETENSVRESDVPQLVRDAASKFRKNGVDVSFEKKTVVLYSVEMVVDGDEKELLLDPAGRQIEFEVDNDPEDDDEDDHDSDD